MNRLLLLPLAAFALASATDAAPAPDPYRLPREGAAARQSIRLNVDPRGAVYDGSVTIALHVAKAVTTFRLHAEEIEIRRLALAKGSEAIATTFAPAGLK